MLLRVSLRYCLLLLMYIQNNAALNTCNKSVNIARRFYHHVPLTTVYGEREITILQSVSFTNRLVNEVIRQLLTRRVGYSNVSNTLQNALSGKAEYQPVTNCSTNVTLFPQNNQTDLYPVFPVTPPSTYVVRDSRQACLILDWPPYFLVTTEPARHSLGGIYTDYGSIGFWTQYRLYMSRLIINDSQAATTGLVSYLQLNDDERISQFHNSSHKGISLVNIIQQGSEPLALTCLNNASCVNNVYIPTICRTKSCATVFVRDHAGDHLLSLMQKIEWLKLRLKIMNIGEELEAFVMRMKDERLPVLFFTQYPDLLSTDSAFFEVRFSENESDPMAANFPVIATSIKAWKSLINSEELIHEFFKRIQISQSEIIRWIEDYRELYKEAISQEQIEAFIREKITLQCLGDSWIPPAVSKKPVLYLGGLFPISPKGVWKQPNLIPAANMALDRINKDDSILSEFDIEMILSDTGCDSSWVLNIFTGYLLNETVWNRMIGGLGPACSDTALALAGLARHHNFVLISYSVEAMVLSLDRQRYPFFFRTIPQINEYAEVYVSLFKKLGWTRYKVSLLTDDSGEFPYYHRIIADEFKKQDIDLVSQDLLPKKDFLFDGYSKYLEKIKAYKSKIIILDVYAEVARAIMCEAFHKKMTLDEGYVWFLPSFLQWDWYDKDYRNPQNLTCSTKEIKEVIRGYFTLSHSNIDNSEQKAVGGISGKEFWQLYRKDTQNLTGMKFPSEYGPYAYDAVWVFAKALDALYKENPAYLKYLHTPYANQHYVEKIHATEFRGVSGMITFNQKGDRSGITDIKQYYIEEDGYFEPTAIGTWVPLPAGQQALYKGNLTIFEDRIIFNSSFKHEDPPEDRCPWVELRDAVGLSCSGALVFVIVTPCALIFVVCLLYSLFWVRRYKSKYRKQQALTAQLEGKAYPAFNLDEKEIPRDNIVLNRKLAEGAFGTVYGGEGYINSAWIGVAVKTLKAGSKCEAKLDFLREADIMKRFDHKNIVKLLGVSTVGEPAYVIMEFMLYGDLRSFLLSRRELVGCPSREAEDVSALSLTRMAKDVVEGINYLHQKEYVHRDIACRNCLVAANKTVKIGDFGLTRRVYDQGYYVFSGRGKLPVRWMAPESLDQGIYTYKTDVWSYGVFLYELVTFGSIPYQWLSDEDVFETLKFGVTLTLPKECTDDLKALILRCWKLEPMQRPSAADIAVQLQGNECLIQPLLANPSYAMIREEQESDEMAVSPTTIKSLPLWKKPVLRQSSSVDVTHFGRHRNFSETSHRRIGKRKSSHSIIDLVQAPISVPLPSPSHSLGNSTFQFSLDNRHVNIYEDYIDTRPYANSNQQLPRLHHDSGDSSNHQLGNEHVCMQLFRAQHDQEDGNQTACSPLLFSSETNI